MSVLCFDSLIHYGMEISEISHPLETFSGGTNCRRRLGANRNDKR